MFKLVVALAASGVSLSACSTAFAPGSMQHRGMAGADLTPEQAMPYVMIAGAGDLYELQSSQLMHQRGRDPRLHRFASMMTDHHSRTTAATIAAARASGINPPPPQLLPMQRAMLARLQALNGVAFDLEYLRQQRTAHQMALALHSHFARAGNAMPLRSSAATAVPVVRQHLAQLGGIRI